MCEKILDKLKESLPHSSKGFVEAQLSAPNGIVTYRPSGMQETLYICMSINPVITVFCWQ